MSEITKPVNKTKEIIQIITGIVATVFGGLLFQGKLPAGIDVKPIIISIVCILAGLIAIEKSIRNLLRK